MNENQKTKIISLRVLNNRESLAAFIEALFFSRAIVIKTMAVSRVDEMDEDSIVTSHYFYKVRVCSNYESFFDNTFFLQLGK